ncbi:MULTISPECIES: non-ribosomal peptide synthase/polyketide synthase [Pseudomonas]|uniref:Amino acid adenylation domain-containing protein/non-ribosomal peptide synthase protein (TIGR01720 family) n=1 Tax=Pseudomonas umsongensis TaxID=198618 RepID=A0ACC5M8T2_9PSED|nr:MULTISPECIES: non-ribosomal peptide synthetase [Pseudomonas]MBB2885147.1 amino acid adenylation domain-containing protein/non-ribosomal peptide synthase protein (TIGR01720 family) [Pseudomonas umsongensis]NMN74789.1 non-ribosomal peptide synthase protein (TIGR01720 family)/amino acid adenylation domain-containing protein [Pseudomonas sp. KD5]
MDTNVALKIARRFITLPLDKRRVYLQKMLEEGVSPANLPIPETQSQFDPVPLSFAQERQWFLWQMDPDSAAYNIPSAMHLQGELDIAALERGFNALIARHQSLRTTFRQQDEQAVQVIHPHMNLTVAVHELDERPDALSPEAQIQAFVSEQTGQPFDLINGPLLRVSLLRLGAQEHVLTLTQHHIASDGASMRVMVDELLQLYGAYRQGHELDLPPLSIQYADYGIWQRHWMEAGERERQLDYWQAHLGSEHPVLELPTDYPRPAVQSLRGARHELALPPALGERLRALAKSENVTLFMLLLASFQTLLHRYSGQAEIRVGVPTANRNRVETERLIGFFVNTQVLKTEFDAQATFSTLLARVKQTAMAAQAHQDLPFEQLVEALHPERSLSYSPLFQVMYNHQSTGASQSRQGTGESALTIRHLHQPSRTAQFDLTLETFDGPEGLGAQLTYATDLFDGATIERLARHWQNLLGSLVADPQQRVGELALLDETEQQQVLVDWNRSAAEYPTDRCIHQLIEAQARRTPEATALVFDGQSLSYAQLNRQANQLAHRLIERGVGPDQLVGIAIDRSLEMLIGLLAILKAGGAYVPLDPQYPEDRLAHMIEDSGLQLLLTQAHLTGQLPIPAGVQTLLLDPQGEHARCYSEADPQVALSGEHLAYAIYTSGSTGKPKGVMVRHQALVNFVVSMVKAPGIEARDRMLSLTTFSFDIFGLEIYGPLLSGARVVLVDKHTAQDPQALLEMIRQQQVTVVQATPSTWRMLLDHEQAPTLQGCKFLCGGEALADDLAHRMLGLAGQVWNLYGPTETTIWSAAWQLTREQRQPYLGKPIANTTLYILGDDLAPNPAGSIGELLIGGDGLARGYHDRAAMTAERFLPDPFGNGARLYRTGDLARHRHDGVLEYMGRIDHQVKIRGFRIELGEIEARLLEQPAVREVAVLAQEALGSQQLVAYVVASHLDLDAADEQLRLRDELKARLKECLPEFMVPAHLLFLASLPLTPNGKLNRKALPAVDASQLQARYVAPQSERQQQVATIWQDVLKLDRVGLTDNFFELGGHSLLVTQVVSRVRRVLGIQVPLRSLFEHSTLEDFVQALGAEPGEQSPPMTRVDRDQPLALSFAQERQWFLWKMDPDSAAYNIPTALRMRGALDKNALQCSFQALVERHESLRTAFVEEDGRTWQVIRPQGRVSFVEQRLAACDEASIKAFVEQETQRPFDVLDGSLVRFVLLQVGEQDHVLILTLHHIVSDAWSLQVMIDDLMALYAAISQGRPAELPPLPVQYADYAVWQRQWMAAGERDRQLAYWCEKLGSEQPLLELPLDHPRPAQQSFRGARLPIALDESLSNALKALARRENVTLFMLLLGSFQTLLHRYSGQADIRVGVPIANRNRLETERLIGFFVNTQVLRAEFDGQLTGAQLLQQVKQTAMAAQMHQDLPFEQLVDALQSQRNLSHSPLFQAMFNHRSESASTLAESLPGIELAHLSWEHRTAQFDLTLDTSDNPQGLHASLTYATDLFEPSTIERMGRHWLNLLQGLVEDIHRPVGQLALLDDRERQLTVVDWNATAVDYPLHRSVQALIEEQVGKTPQACALVFAEQRLSYAELNGRANQLAHVLIEQGVGPDVPVGIAVERSVEMVVGLLAILKAGGAYLPLDPEYPQERLAYMFEDSGIQLLLTQSHLLEQLPIPAGIRSLVLDQDGDWLEGHSDGNPSIDIDGENLAYVIYTSGSTGKPKGAGNRHSALVNRLCWMQQAYRLDATDSVLQKTPFSFDVSVWEFFWPLLTGSTLVVAAPGIHRDPAQLIELITAQRITTLHFVPSMLQAFLQDPAVGQCRSLTRIVCSGEALPVDAQQQVFAKLPNAGLYNLYGPTEAAIDVTHWTCIEEGRDSVPIGQPIANLGTYILDHELSPVPVGVIGELYLGGEGLARGYHRRPSLTAERFATSPFGDGQRLYRTGDLARYRADGVIEYAGRMDHQVKIRGLRIELGEIEARLAEHAEVRETVVIAQDGTLLVAYVVPARDALLHADDETRNALQRRLKEHLSQTLPDYMVPQHWLWLENMPVSPNGKLERKALPKADTTASSKAYSAPTSAIEQALVEIWQSVLGRPQVGISDNFFELGGDSIISIQVVSRARQAGIHFSPKDLFLHQNVQSLAAVAKVGDSDLRIDQGPVTGDTPLLPFQQLFFEREMVEPHHWNQSVLLKSAKPLHAEHLERALQALVSHHDGLRLAFSRQGDNWTAQHRSLAEQQALWQQSPLLWTAEVADAAALEQLGEQAQRSLELASGNLLRAVLANMADGSQRLLLVIHHLVVDGVSWRILLEDLQQTYEQLQAGQTLTLPAKTSATQAWARRLQQHADSPAMQAQLRFWQEQLQDARNDLPCDRPQGELHNRHALHAHTRLDKQQTRQLLQEAPAAYRTQVNDLLLTALARVIADWTGEASTLIQLEGHGREALFDELDLSRSVGWFTSLFPVRLTPASTPQDSIKTIKEQLRAIPDKGLGFGALRYLGNDRTRQVLQALPVPRITFNYLGQFDAGFGDEAGALFTPASESAGAEQSPLAPLDNWLTLNGRVYGGELSIGWTFSGQMFDPSTIERLAQAYARELGLLIEHCCEARHQGLTPSDFSLAGLTQRQLDALPVTPRQVEDIYPLSPMQQGMLFHTLYEQQAGDYINQLCVDVEGLNVERFREAWQAAMDAHDVLRSSFVWDGEFKRPLQVIHKQLAVPFTFHDWRDHSDVALALSELAAAQRQQGFDLAAAPLLNLTVVRLDTARFHLIYTSHHILMDGWSNSQLLGEVLQRYSGQVPTNTAGRYRDYIEWLTQQDAQVTEGFWKGQLAGFDEPTRLAKALVWTGSDAANTAQGEHFLTLDQAQTAGLNGFAREQKVTLNTLVQAAWLLLLQRYTGLDTVSFGATVSGRPAQLAGVEQQIGLFINTLPVVASPRAEQPLAQWLQQVQAQNLALREQEHTALFDIQRWAGQGGEALFDNILVFENYPISEALQQGAPQDLRFGEVGNFEQTNYPLTLSVNLGAELSFQLSFDRQQFDDAAIEQLAGHLAHLLLQMVEAPAASAVGDLALVSTAVREPLALPVDEVCVQRLFERQAERTPQALALIFDEQRLSYAQLNDQANQLARVLLQHGVGPEVLVGIAVERSTQMIISLLAVLKAGGAYVPLDPEYPAERLGAMIEDSGLRVLLTQSHLVPKLPEAAGVTVLSLDQLDYPTQTDNLPQRSGPQNLAYVMFTSGSTGRPKGVGITQSALTRHARVALDFLGLTPQDRSLQFATFNFDAFVEQLYPALICGASVVLRGPDIWDSETWYRELRDKQFSVSDLTTAYWNMLAKDLAAAGHRDYGALRQMIVGGEAMPPEGVAAWGQAGLGHVRLLNTYGPTEATVSATLLDCSDYVSGRNPLPVTMPIGRALGGRAIHVLDTQGQPAPVGVVGELVIGGELLARGYFQRPELTAERFIPDPFDPLGGGRVYRTGDLARYRADGVIEYVGRVDHQVKIRGLRIELGEIETHLLRVPAVRQALVVAQPGAIGQQLVAYVVFDDPAQARADSSTLAALRNDIKARLKASLPDYMVPAHVLFLESLPLSPNGKIDRKALPGVDASLLASDFVAPEGALEQQIATVWQDVLELQQVGRDDHFFELGGHSLLATQAVSRLRKLTACTLSLRDLFSHPRLKDLAAWIAQQQGTPEPNGHHGVVLKAHGTRHSAPLSLVQRRLWIAEQLSGGTAAYGMSMALRLRGELSVERLISSFAEVVRRHEVLRTAYTQDDEGDPIAVIAEQVELDFPVIDLSGLSRSAQEEWVAQAALENARTPIDMEHAPLLRGRILHLGPTEHVMLYAMHHIISDGWSMGLLVNELVQIYHRTKAGDLTPLPALEVQYSDFALWQQELEQQGVLARQAEYWKARLAGYDGHLKLPSDNPRGLTPSYAGDSVQFKLTTPLSTALRQLSMDAGVTLYSTLLASFQVLLHQVSGVADVLVGADVAGREQPELERLIGFFVNVLPLRSQFDAATPFARFLGQTQESLLSAMEHQDLPFDMIVDASDVPRHKGMNPLVQVLFVMNNLPGRTQAMGGLSVESLPALETHSKFDMALFVDDEAGQLLGNWQFATTLFGHERIQHLVKAWIALLEQIVADQDILLGAISMPVDNLAVAAKPAVPGPKADKLGKFLKRGAAPAAKARPAPIRESLIAAPQPFPLLLEPNEPHLDLIEWINNNRPLIEEKLARHAGILFRGFELDGIQGFEAFAEAIQPGLYGQYGDLPKKEGGKNTYRSTPYPERKMILFHNESSHQDRWPRKQMFYCEQAASIGGATPVVDCRLMYEKLPADLRDKFEEKGLLYVRTFTDNLDVSWQHFFKTEDRAEVEARCRAGGIEWRWLDNNELQTRTPGPAIIRHPVTGAKSFFNQVQLHHIYWLEPDVREDLLSMFGLDRLPRHVFYGDGTPIEDEVMQRIGDLYEECAVRFDWQKGDAILLDNMLVAHARDPFEGPRKIVVAMGDMFDRSALERVMNTEETGA